MISTAQVLIDTYPYVFDNEFNKREILTIEQDVDFGRECVLYYRPLWGFSKEREDALRDVKAVKVLTKDKFGETQLFRFWTLQEKYKQIKNAYSELNQYELEKFLKQKQN